MFITGNGLIARSLEAHASRHDGVLAMAAGVSASRTSEPAAYQRELDMLGDHLRRASTEGLLLVYFSGGGAVYGPTSAPAAEGQRLRPGSRYGQHQVVCERLIRESGVRHLIVRLPNVVGGTGNARQLVPSLVEQVLAGHVVAQSKATRDLIDADDMAQVVSEILEAGPEQVTVNVASGHSVPVPELVDTLISETGASPRVFDADVGESQRFDVSLMRQLIGRDPFPDSDYYRPVVARRAPEILEALGIDRSR